MSAGRHVNTLSQSWCTPLKYVIPIRNFFGGKIDLDPCSNEFSVVNANTEFRLPFRDGLVETWQYNTIFVNPPYGADRERGTTIKNWLVKCCQAHAQFKSEVIALVPVATNTTHWKQCVFGQAAAICFLYDTRLKFIIDGNSDNKGAPMACCLIYWGKRVEEFRESFLPYGAVVDIRGLRKERIGQSCHFSGELFEVAI